MLLISILSYLIGCKRLASREYLDRNYAKASDILFTRNENGDISLKDDKNGIMLTTSANDFILSLVSKEADSSFVSMQDENMRFDIFKSSENEFYMQTLLNGYSCDIKQVINKESDIIETMIDNITDSSGEKYLLATSEAFTSLVERVAAVEKSLSTKIQILENKIENLNNKNGQLENDVDKLNSENSELENDVDKLRSEASKWESMYYSAIKTPTSKPATPTPNTPKPVTYTATKEPDTPTPEPVKTVRISDFTLDVDETGKILILKWDGYAQNRISYIHIDFDVHSISSETIGNAMIIMSNLENNDDFAEQTFGMLLPSTVCQSEYCQSVKLEVSRNLGESFIKIKAVDDWQCTNDLFMCSSEGQSVNERFEVCPCKKTKNEESYIIFIT